MEEAILQWFSVLGAEPAGIGRISDLADGIILARVLASADPQWFRFQVKSDADDDNWVVRFNRWKKLHKLLFGYYEQVLRLSTTHFETCNITAIAKDRNEDEILKFARLVVALTVQCENNKKFITKMQSLDSDHQHHLMMIIEEVMKLTAVSASPSTDISANHSDGGPFSFHRQSATEPTSNDIGYRRVSTRETHGQIIAQNAMLKDRVKELELQLAHMPEAGQGDSMWRAETDTLRQEIATHEAARVDLEQSIAKHEADSALLNRKIQYAEEQTRELETLRDSVQEVSAMADKLQKAEALVDKYRRRFEETKDLRKLLAASESNVVKLVERNETLEKDASKVPALLQTIEKLKESLDGSRHASESLRSELENMSAQLAETRSFSDQQMSERVRDQDHIHMLEEKLADLEMLKGELHSKRNFEDLPNLAEAKIPTIHPKTPKSPIPDDATSPRDNASSRRDSLASDAHVQAQRLAEQLRASMGEVNRIASERERLSLELLDAKGEILQRDRTITELRGNLAAMECQSQTSDEMMQKMGYITKQIVESQQKNEELHSALKQAKNRIAVLDRQCKENAAMSSMGDLTSPTYTSMQTLLVDKDNDIQRLAKEITETRKAAKREQILIASAWAAGLRSPSHHHQQQPQPSEPVRNPKSWLLRERRNLLMGHNVEKGLHR